MTEQAADTPIERDDLYNSILTGTYMESEEQGHLFALPGDFTAIVASEEFAADSLPEPGQAFEMLVERPHGKRWSASVLKAEKLATLDRLEKLAAEGGTIEGIFVAQLKGGLSVDAGVRGFVPWSHVDLHRVEDASPYLGREFTFQVIEFDAAKCRLVLSRRKVLRQEREDAKKRTIADIEPGKVFDGVVRSVRPYGAFVDIGGVEGLLHVSNMSWARVDHANELVRPGDEVRVVVLDYDKKKDRLSLGRKQLLQDPWDDVAERFAPGTVTQGKVVSLADFGAFIEIAPGLEGLVHVTELAWTGRVNHPKELLELGQEVGVRVISADVEGRRLGLSIKQLERNPWEELSEKFSPGDRVTGEVRSITDFGAFVEVLPGIEGLVHLSNITWASGRSVDPNKHFKVGDEVEVAILSVDTEAQRLELGVKQLSQDPWELAADLAVVGKKISVEISRVEAFGAFAKIVEGVEGLIHISELQEDPVEDVSRVVRPGKKVEALVMSFDRANQRISLSLKRDELGEPEVRSYTDEGSATSTLGDILREQLGLGAGEEE